MKNNIFCNMKPKMMANNWKKENNVGLLYLLARANIRQSFIFTKRFSRGVGYVVVFTLYQVCPELKTFLG